MISKLYTFRQCPVCGCKTANFLFPVNLYVEDMGLPNSYRTVQCDYCGMCYADTTASKEEYDQYYCNFNYYGNPPTDTTISDEVLSQRYHDIEELLVRYSKQNCSILDVGFGRGELLQYLKSKQFTCLSGMDPSEESVRLLEKRGINSFCGSLQADIPEKYYHKYDFVILRDVLEHLFLPSQALQNIKKLLAPSGCLILRLPLFDDLSQYKLPMVNIINQEHINFFSVRSLRSLMEANGFYQLECIKTDIERDPYSKTLGILGAYRLADSDQNPICYDNKTGEELCKYMKQQEKILLPKFHMLNELFESQVPLAIWGVGSFLRYLWCETVLPLCNIVMLVDGSRQKQGNTFCNYPIQAPKRLEKFQGTLLVSTIRNHDEIIRAAQTNGFLGDIKLVPTTILPN